MPFYIYALFSLSVGRTRKIFAHFPLSIGIQIPKQFQRSQQFHNSFFVTEVLKNTHLCATY